MALKDERSQKYAFPEAGTSLLKSPTKSLLYVLRFSYVSTFLNAGYWLAASCCTAAVALTATDAAGTLEKISITAAAAAGAADPSKGGFRQGNPMLLRGDSDCCCCAHKDTALPDEETPWP